MNRIRTGDIVRAFKLIWPHITGDMVRNAEIDGKIRAIRNPFSERSGLFYDPTSIQEFLMLKVVDQEINQDQANQVLRQLGINCTQLRLVHSVSTAL